MSHKVICDCDGILWGFHATCARAIAEHYGLPEVFPHRWGWYQDLGLTEVQALEMFEETHRRQIWSKPFDGAQELLKTCMDKYGQVIVASHRNPKFAPHLAAWLLKNNLTSFTGMYAGHDKFVFFAKGDLVIDDAPYNINKALKVGAIPITLAWPWNRGTNALRFGSLQEMAAWIKNEPRRSL